MVRYKTHDGNISVEEFFSILKYFDKNLLTGIECERVVPQNNQELAMKLGTQFVDYGRCHNEQATFNLYRNSQANQYNVAFVTHDGSFAYNNEILYGGNLEDYEWNYQKLLLLENKLDSLRAKNFDSETSNHITVLTSYNRLLHPIILKNVMNIVKAYSSALFWIGSGDERNVVRSNVREYANSLNHVNVNNRNIQRIIENTSKYIMFNFSKQKVMNYNSIMYMNGVCIEFRSPDGIRIPSVLSALMQLFRAIVYKAVELSLHGIAQVESMSTDWRTNKRICQSFINMNYSPETMNYETSDTGFMQIEANRLIDFVLPYLKRCDSRVVEVLRALAKEPVSIRRWKRKTNKQIDKDLHKNNKTINGKNHELMKKIVSKEVQAETIGEWKKKIAGEFSCTVRNVEKIMNRIQDAVGVILYWDKDLQSVNFR